MPETPARHWKRVAALLDDALERRAEERACYLDEVCAADAELRNEIQALLALGQAPCFLDSAALDFMTASLGTEDIAHPILFQERTALAGLPYALERRLGRGGTATVYLARDAKHDRRVALKVLHSGLMGHVESERFVQEIRLTARLQHPHVLALLDSGVFPPEAGALAGRPYYVMPYVEGESLRTRLATWTALELREAMHLLREVADALCYAHRQGVIHRDIKPENILISGGHAVVADFGIAKAIFASHADESGTCSASDGSSGLLTDPGTRIGTPAYMAPEQGFAGEVVDHRADIYSWGVVAYELLAGKHPFPERTRERGLAQPRGSHAPLPLQEAAPAVPRALALLVMRCLASAAADRPDSSADIVAAVDAAMVAAAPGELTHPEGAVGWRRRLAVLAIVVVSIGLVSAALIRGRIWRATSGTSAVAAKDTTGSVCRTTRSTEAYDLCLQGRQFFGRRADGSSLVKSVATFDSAIRLDSSYAAAYAGRSTAYSVLSIWGFKPPREGFPLAKAAALRALALDSTLAEAHVSLGVVSMWFDLDGQAAARELTRAITLDPRNPDAHLFYAWLLASHGATSQAVAEARRARDLEPLSVILNTRVGTMLSYAGRYDEALTQLHRTLALDSTNAMAHAELARVYMQLGRCRDALSSVGRLPLSFPNSEKGVAGDVYAKCGRRREAAAMLRSLQDSSRRAFVFATRIALLDVALGAYDEAFAWLDRAIEQRDPASQLLAVEPQYRPLHGDPRFRRLLVKAGLQPPG